MLQVRTESMAVEELAPKQGRKLLPFSSHRNKGKIRTALTEILCIFPEAWGSFVHVYSCISRHEWSSLHDPWATRQKNPNQTHWDL